MSVQALTAGFAARVRSWLRRHWHTAFAPPVPGESFYRHRAPVRLAHWLNALCILFLLGTGLNIFNAHPRLYWGQYGANGEPADPAFLEIGAVDTDTDDARGITRIGPWHFDTTGILGVSQTDGDEEYRAWPHWLTIPRFVDLADARRWHFLFAWLLVINGVIYLGFSLWVRHMQRDLWPSRADIRSIPRSIWDHLRLKHPSGEAARRYNVLQKLAYLGVLALIALMVLTGLTMSPGFDAIFPPLLDLFGGRQSARSLHFLSAMLIVLFVIVHVTEVFLAGPINEIRSMLGGWFRLPRHHEKDAP